MIDVASALTDIEAYLARTGVAEGTFGKCVVGDFGFLDRLRSRRVNIGKAEKALRFIADVPEPPRRAFVRAAREWSEAYDAATAGQGGSALSASVATAAAGGF